VVKVTAAELQKQFGTYSDAAQREPVTITKHGRDSLVLMSVDAYERLKSFDTRRAYLVEEAPQEFIDAIMKAEAPAWAAMYNHELDEE
jgi:prevent-host-death family protein